ncbi:MAG: HD domain-containing protein [candidate division WOR-3 bacterium]|jgi:HD-GYP domain-containing protein (c-di-GMP phosphodiesterase class II)
MKQSDIRNLILYFSSSIHIARVFQTKSQTLYQHAEKMHQFLTDLFKELKKIELSISDNHLFFNDERATVEVGIMGRYRSLIHDLKTLSIGSILFEELPELEELVSFLCCLGMNLAKMKHSFETVADNLKKDGVKYIKISRIEDSNQRDGILRSIRKEALSSLLDSIGYLKKVTIEEEANIFEAKRIVRKFTDLLFKERSYLIALTIIKDIGSYTFNHSANVCILSIAMGIELGISRKDLLELGIAALFHDLGKIDIPGDILNKPDTLTNIEYEKIKQHPYLSAERIIFLKGIDEVPVFALRGILEHHIDFSGSGYPEISTKKPTLFARIIRIVDSYDAMTTPRIYQNVRSPFEALKYIVKSTDIYDPSLVKVFLDIMGIYPPGTIVLLKGNLKGVMVSENEVAVIKKGKISKSAPKETTIVRALSPNEIDFDVASVLTAIAGEET